MKDRVVVSYSPVVAQQYGRSAAIFLSQLQFWLGKKPHTIDGKKWVYNTYEEWADQTGLSVPTLKRVVARLRRANILHTSNFNRAAYDRTLWYAIDNRILADSIVSNDTMEGIKRSNGGDQMTPPIPVLTTEVSDIEDLAPSQASVLNHPSEMKGVTVIKGKTAVEVLTALQKQKVAPVEITDAPTVAQAKAYWRKRYVQVFAIGGVLPPFTQKEQGEFKHLVIRCEGKAGILLRRIFEDWSSCRHHVELISGKKLPLYPDVGVVLSHLVYILNWSLKEHESVQLVAPAVKAPTKEAVPKKEKPIWLEE